MECEQTLGQRWFNKLGHLTSIHTDIDKTCTDEQRAQAQARADKIIRGIPGAVEEAMRRETMEYPIGAIPPEDISPGVGDCIPQRSQLSGSAVIVYDYCQKENLFLYIGGTRDLESRSFIGPFTAYIRMTHR